MTTRTAAPALVAGGIAIVAGGIAEQIAQASTTVPEDVFSHPWSADAYVGAAIYWAVAFGLVLAGVAALRTGPGRAWLTLACAGLAIVTVAQLASIAVRDEQESGVVVVLFALGTVLLAAGLIGAGRTRREGRFPLALLAAGICTVALMALVTTPLAQLADVAFGILIAAAGLPAAAQERGARSIALD